MLSVSLQRFVTYSKDLKNGYTSMWDSKYKDLSKHLEGEKVITVRYPFGRHNLRTKQLENLGYQLSQTIYFHDDADHSPIKQVWIKK